MQGVLSGVAGLVLTLALVGCGGSGNGTAPETPGSPIVTPTVTPAATLPAHAADQAFSALLQTAFCAQN